MDVCVPISYVFYHVLFCSIWFQVKALDLETIAFVSKMASQCGSAVARAMEALKHALGFDECHVRELLIALYMRDGDGTVAREMSRFAPKGLVKL